MIFQIFFHSVYTAKGYTTGNHFAKQNKHNKKQHSHTHNYSIPLTMLVSIMCYLVHQMSSHCG